MRTLLVRYAAPLMAFGHTSVFNDRHTAVTPTVSAVQGTLAAAAGVGRADPLPDWLVDVHLAIRVERHGGRLADYQSINPPNMRLYRWLDGDRRVNKKGQVSYSDDKGRIRTVRTADGNLRPHPVVGTRHYVSDAEFLLAIADPDGHATDALTRPRWAIYAGRKSCPLTAPLIVGHHPEIPERAVAAVPSPRQPDDPYDTPTVVRTVETLTPSDDARRSETRNDRLVGFKQHRPQTRYQSRVEVPAADDWWALVAGLAPHSETR